MELVINGVFVSLEGFQRRDSHPRTEVFAALGQPVLMHGARPAWDQVQQPCRGMILPSSQVYDASELTGAPAVSVLVMPHMLVNPQHPNPRKTGRVIRCGSQTRLDMGPHSIPRGATYPASLKPPEPCRDPGPGCVDHLHHHAPVALCDSPRNPGSQHSDHRTLCRASEPVGCEPRLSDGSPPNRRADHTDHNDQATHSSR